ncbi:hypothetical protein [Mitsuokella sp. WILCCON 0060]|uniref:hypothetical protein n=1 Tax=unclassified Mitsuokella TaxID=2637239 RepID=UPI003F0BB6D7
MEQEKLVFRPLKEVFHIQELDVCTRDKAGVILGDEVYTAEEHMGCIDHYLTDHPQENIDTLRDKPRAGFHVIGKNLIFGSLPFFTNMKPQAIFEVLHAKYPAHPIYYYNEHKHSVARLYPRAAAVSAA